MVVQHQSPGLGGLSSAKHQRTWVQVRVRSMGMGRVWVCMLLCYRQIHHSHMVAQHQVRDLWGLNCAKHKRTWSQVRVKSVVMERVWVCMILYCSPKHCILYMVVQNQTRDLWGLSCTKIKGPEYQWERGTWTWEGWECVWYSVADRYSADIWSNKIRYGRPKEGTSPVGVDLWKTPKDLHTSEREDRGYGEGVSTEDVRESVLWYDVVCSRKTVSIKWDLNKRLMFECQCDGRLKTKVVYYESLNREYTTHIHKVEGSTHLVHTRCREWE